MKPIMKTKKKKNALFSMLKVNDYLIIVLILVIVINTITKLSTNQKKLINYKFALIEENVNAYKAGINSNIIERLIILTNVINSTTIISNIYPHLLKKISTDKSINRFGKFNNIDDSFIFDSSSEINKSLSFGVDNVFSVHDKLYIQIGNFYYKEGDTINGKLIDSISPSFVVIDGKYYPIQKEKNK